MMIIFNAFCFLLGNALHFIFDAAVWLQHLVKVSHIRVPCTKAYVRILIFPYRERSPPGVGRLQAHMVRPQDIYPKLSDIVLTTMDGFLKLANFDQFCG